MRPYACSVFNRKYPAYKATMHSDVRGPPWTWDYLDWWKCWNSDDIDLHNIIASSYGDGLRLGQRRLKHSGKQSLLVFDYANLEVKHALDSDYWPHWPGKYCLIGNRHFDASISASYVHPDDDYLHT